MRCRYGNNSDIILGLREHLVYGGREIWTHATAQLGSSPPAAANVTQAGGREAEGSYCVPRACSVTGSITHYIRLNPHSSPLYRVSVSDSERRDDLAKLKPKLTAEAGLGPGWPGSEL